MKVVTQLPQAIRTLGHVSIPMPDGTRLAARIWMPTDAERQPVPAILEYIPYRKRDTAAGRDETIHPYLAGHGYACVRVDLRGSGDSEGVLEDEYLQQELDDGLEVIRWIAEQPWCSGSVGMMGISWGGFNALQVAALRPPELKAIISLCASDDRYADDVHHMGGCLLGDNLSWASVMFAFNACPPDPELVGERWRDMWFQRLEGSGLWLEKWLRHQRRDTYWQHGSVCEDYSAIQCPVMAVSGWADGYSNAVFRLMANLQVPRKGLVGPWSHKYPHIGVPGPAIGFLQEALRWWDQWLKGVDRGLTDEPMVRVWMQDSVPPTPRYRHRPGRWVAEDQWPSSRLDWTTYRIASSRLAPAREAVDEAPLDIQSPLSVGLFAGKWCSYAAAPDLPHDQREEDGGALVFESDPLAAPIEILGPPIAELELTANKPVAMVAVRLSDVAPNNEATRVTYGLLNLTHRDSHEHPEALTPGERYRVRVQLNDIAQAFPAGHRLRLSISPSYWPLAWPAPEPARLTIIAGASSLQIPIRPGRDEDAQLRPFDEPEGSQKAPRTVLEPEHHNWRVERDLAEDRSVLEVVNDHGRQRIEPIDLETREDATEWYSYRANDYDSVRGETLWQRVFRRGEWSVQTTTRTVLRSDATFFYVHAELDAYEGDRRVYSGEWDYAIPRDLV